MNLHLPVRIATSLAVMLLSAAFFFTSIVATSAAQEAPQAVPQTDQLPPMPPPHESPEPKVISTGHHAGPQITGNTEQSYDCPYCSLHGFDFSNRDLTDANLEGADLSNANFTGAILNGVVMTRANLTGANFTQAKLDTTSDGRADLSVADLDGAVFTGAQTQGTDFEFSEMKGTDFGGADLSGALVGPEIKAGTANGKKTSFRNARVAKFRVDPEKVDVTGTKWHTPIASHRKLVGSAEWSCDSADLSRLSSVVYVNPTGNDNAQCGSTAATACQTIQQGINRCSGNYCGVLAYWAEYTLSSPIQLSNGVSLYGGCLATPPTDGYSSALIAPASGVPAITASRINTATTLQGFKLIGGSPTAANGAPTFTLLVTDSSSLSIANIEFVAGKGAPGAAGGTGGAGAAGGNGSGQSGGTVNSCSNTQGGNGGSQMNVSVSTSAFKQYCTPSCGTNGCWGLNGYPGSTGKFVSGGSPGGGNCTCCPWNRGGTGNTGSNGQNGSCGGKGNVSTTIAGSFSGSTWTGVSGGNGGTGGNASGGGGGGAGGYKAGTCFWVKTEDPGNVGGGGGAGGCGASGGGGGQQGGASFGIVAANSTLIVANSRLVGGRSGDGGKGGPGNLGGKNGSGAGGAGNQSGGYGGPGGPGGAGGASGGGAGGNSGPSINVALMSSSLAANSVAYYLGHEGIPGLPGSGGTPIITGACAADTGDTGVSGLVANTHDYY